MANEKDLARLQLNKFKKMWMEEWHAQPNPFIAWEWWTSDEQKARRKAVYDYFECEVKDGRENVF